MEVLKVMISSEPFTVPDSAVTMYEYASNTSNVTTVIYGEDIPLESDISEEVSRTVYDRIDLHVDGIIMPMFLNRVSTNWIEALCEAMIKRQQLSGIVSNEANTPHNKENPQH
ncbi:MAG: hypothetical protein DRP01_10865 [Archaeoglobales archaeon]|nr:MAG: hypothetical protein DRP01_10865 [Archaeoglobales archaeon]